MSHSDGHINAARIDRSKRLQIILELLKQADYPLSAEEISRLAYDFKNSNRIMLNISTNIGEMRSEENQAAGYLVSKANKWSGGKYPWHDGRPRFWLIAAPGWQARWAVSDDGELHTVSHVKRPPAESDNGPEISPDETSAETQRRCHNPQCNKPLPPGESYTCDAVCNKAWRESLRPKVAIEPIEQGRLL